MLAAVVVHHERVLSRGEVGRSGEDFARVESQGFVQAEETVDEPAVVDLDAIGHRETGLPLGVRGETRGPVGLITLNRPKAMNALCADLAREIAEAVDAYEADLIKKHEFTRPDKEDDRVRHMDALGAQVGPVFVTYEAQAQVDALVAEIVLSDPEYDFQAEDETHHIFWSIQDEERIAALETAINELDCLYVADGHHRSAAASRVRNLHRDRNPEHSGEESYNFFLVVLFPHDQMQILDYNRIIKDFGDKTAQAFLAELGANFVIKPVGSAAEAKPLSPQQFGLYLENQWYHLVLSDLGRSRVNEGDPVDSLDVSILQQTMLGPILGIHDQRTDKRIDFVGGIRGLEELEKRVDSGNWQAAIALHPTSIESLMSVADAGEVMPPKSTWFEPKLKSGLIVHVLD